MFRRATTAVLAVLATVCLASAADKAEKPKKPIGVWTRTVNDCTIMFTFADDKLTCQLTRAGGEEITVHAAYGITDDGLMFGVLTGVEKKGTDGGPEKGDLVSFMIKLDKDTLTLSDLNTSKGASDEGRRLLEGEYKAKK